MANKVCRPVTKIPDFLVGTVLVGSTTLYPGNIILANTCTTDISGNYSVFEPTQPLTSNLDQQMAIIINGGWEMLSDGRRPEGQPDYTQYEFVEGDVVTIIFLQPKMRFEISFDCVDGTPVANTFLYPTDQSYLLTKGESVPAGTYSPFKVLALKNFRLGGLYGAQFASTAIAIVEQPTLAVDLG